MGDDMWITGESYGAVAGDNGLPTYRHRCGYCDDYRRFYANVLDFWQIYCIFESVKCLTISFF
jgi:hypothetical protein